jgi:hypothetical protein
LEIFTRLLAWFKIVIALILAGLIRNTLVNSCEDLQNPQEGGVCAHAMRGKWGRVP